MKVNVNYPDRLLMLVFAGLTLLFTWVLLKYAVMWAIAAVFICFLLAFFMNGAPGSCTADAEGVEIKKLTSCNRMRYEDIQWVYTDIKRGSTHRGTTSFSVIYEINFVTSKGNFSCRAEKGRAPDALMFYDESYRANLLAQSPFAEFESYVKDRIAQR